MSFDMKNPKKDSDKKLERFLFHFLLVRISKGLKMKIIAQLLF